LKVIIGILVIWLAKIFLVTNILSQTRVIVIQFFFNFLMIATW